ncbi:MAG: flagellin [Dermatophilus congolensis]|nr:flagellin [Dermatophilus congolensis]
MGLQINTNVNALNAYRNLTGTQGSMTTSLERLSSGLRINRAADDAAGLAISEKLRSQVNGLNQAQANAQDGVSLIQTAEGALNETHAILQRMRTLAVQSASDTNTTADRQAIQKEVDALVTEIDSTTERTQFNGMNLLDGTFTGKSLQIGANQNQTMDVNIQAMDATGLGITGPAKGLAANGTPGTVGGNVMTGTFTIDGTDVKNSEGLTVGTWDDAAGEATFDAVKDGATIDGTVTFGTAGSGQTSFSVSSAIDLSTQAGAVASLGSIDAAIQRVSDQRADLGALQNRLNHTINNLGVSAENLAASESRIRDTDMAKEMTNFSRSQILQQAGISMLAQANQSSQGVLKLLG